MERQRTKTAMRRSRRRERTRRRLRRIVLLTLPLLIAGNAPLSSQIRSSRFRPALLAPTPAPVTLTLDQVETALDAEMQAAEDAYAAWLQTEQVRDYSLPGAPAPGAIDTEEAP